MNYVLFFGVSALPLLIGFIWYNDKMGFGTAWMNAAGVDPEAGKNMNMPLVFGLCYLFGMMATFFLVSVVIHQMGLGSLVGGDPSKLSPEIKVHFDALSAATATDFRSFKHGVFHGIIAAVFMALPIVGVAALFENRGAKYIFIHLGYWVLCFALMGGLLCAFLEV